jgi:hypothetical protein
MPTYVGAEMETTMRMMRLSVLLLVALVALVGCGSSILGSSSPAPGTSSVPVIDWVNFVHLGGITYLPPGDRVGRQLTSNDLGPVFATVRFKLDGTIHDPAYHAKDGDVAFLDIGTPVYTVENYLPIFRLAAYMHSQPVLFEADTNPHAHTGADLLDIAGKVRLINISTSHLQSLAL